MRIVIAKKLLSTVGGSEVQARALAMALRDRGHAVAVVGLRPAIRRAGIPAQVYDAAPGDVTLEDRGLSYRFIASPAPLLEGTLPISLVRSGRLSAAVAGADVVHCIAREWAGPYERAARAAGAAFVETPLAHPGQPFAGDTRADIARYRRDDAVIGLTQWEADWYRARGAAHAFTTGIGPIAEAAVPDRAPEPAEILFVGRKERYKGYDALREAARLVWRQRPDARFVIIGQRRLLGPAPLADARWSEIGIVSETRKAEAYARATIFAMPSEHETFGHTYLEAWSAGRPVIAGDIAPLREVVREGVDGVHVANRGPAIADAILALLADPVRAAAMGASGRERAHVLFSWPIIAAKTEAVYAAARLA